MPNTFTSKSTIIIHSTPSKVWRALTEPEIIKEYLFDTKVQSDWKEGSKITYTGEWEGKSYEDKGEITELEPEKIFESTYWSSLSGTEDKPENYVLVRYEIVDLGDKCELTVSQSNIKDENSINKSEQNWNYVLESLKKVVEEM